MTMVQQYIHAQLESDWRTLKRRRLLWMIGDLKVIIEETPAAHWVRCDEYAVIGATQ